MPFNASSLSGGSIERKQRKYLFGCVYHDGKDTSTKQRKNRNEKYQVPIRVNVPKWLVLDMLGKISAYKDVNGKETNAGTKNKLKEPRYGIEARVPKTHTRKKVAVEALEALKGF